MKRPVLRNIFMLLCIAVWLSGCESPKEPTVVAAAPPNSAPAPGPEVGSPAWMNTQGGGGTMICETEDKCIISDVFVRGLGDSFRLSDKMQDYLKYIRVILQRYQIDSEEFWDKLVFGRTAEFRFVRDVEDLPCEEAAYLHVEIRGKSSVPFGCTVRQVTYLAAKNFTALGDIRMQALAIVHERLHSLCRSECSGPNKFLITDFLTSLLLLLEKRQAQDNGDRSRLSQEEIDQIYLLYKRAEMIGLEINPNLREDPTEIGIVVMPRGGGIVSRNITVIESKERWHPLRLNDERRYVETARNLLFENAFVGVGSAILVQKKESGRLGSATITASEPLELTDSVFKDTNVHGGSYDKVDALCSNLNNSKISGLYVSGTGKHLNARNLVKEWNIADSELRNVYLEPHGRFFQREKAEPPLGDLENENRTEFCYKQNSVNISESKVSDSIITASSINKSLVAGYMIMSSRLEDVKVQSVEDDSPHPMGHISLSKIRNADIVNAQLYKVENQSFRVSRRFLSFSREKESPRVINQDYERSAFTNCFLSVLKVHGSIDCFESHVSSKLDPSSSSGSQSIHVEGDLNLRNSYVLLDSISEEILSRELGALFDFGYFVERYPDFEGFIDSMYAPDYSHVSLNIAGPFSLENRFLEVNFDTIVGQKYGDFGSETRIARVEETLLKEDAPDMKLIFIMSDRDEERMKRRGQNKPLAIECGVRHGLGDESNSLGSIRIRGKFDMETRQSSDEIYARRAYGFLSESECLDITNR